MIQQEGPGWRLARDPSKQPFPVLIGGDEWAIELTEVEWEVFYTLLRDLSDQHKELEDKLMPEEKLSIELERDPWWANLDGDRKVWDLKVILYGDNGKRRGVEAYWPIPAAQAIVFAVRTMWDSSQ